MDSIPFNIWKTGGLTEHLGGVSATRRLLARCNLAPGQQILDLGCGTGYTACFLAQSQGRARALLLRGLHLLRARGMDFAKLSTSSDNTAMQRAAWSAGFQQESATVWFEKPVQAAE